MAESKQGTEMKEEGSKNSGGSVDARVGHACKRVSAVQPVLYRMAHPDVKHHRRRAKLIGKNMAVMDAQLHTDINI